MIRRKQQRAGIVTALSGLLLLCCGGCSPHNAAAATAPALASPAPPPVFTINTPLHIIAADQRAKAVFEQDVPGVLSNSKYPMFSDMSLSQLATLSSGRITKATLAKVQADLAATTAQQAAGQ